MRKYRQGSSDFMLAGNILEFTDFYNDWMDKGYPDRYYVDGKGDEGIQDVLKGMERYIYDHLTHINVDKIDISIEKDYNGIIIRYVYPNTMFQRRSLNSERDIVDFVGELEGGFSNDTLAITSILKNLLLFGKDFPSFIRAKDMGRNVEIEKNDIEGWRIFIRNVSKELKLSARNVLLSTVEGEEEGLLLSDRDKQILDVAIYNANDGVDEKHLNLIYDKNLLSF